MTKLQAIYEPKGRAAEYARLAVNLYQGCAHGCTYCYAPLVMHKERAAFHAECVARPGILDDLRHDAQLLKGSTEPVLLCFSCDPYQPGATITREALAILRECDVPFTVLSKGGKAWRDFDLYGPKDSFGTTLTCDNHKDSLEWEPHASLPCTRRFQLAMAHRLGIRTWASLEPVLYPEQSLRLIDWTHEFTDHYKVGKLNYHEHAGTIDWRTFLSEVRAKLDGYGASYYIKADLAAYGEAA
jgi:DNA repair photolyase